MREVRIRTSSGWRSLDLEADLRCSLSSQDNENWDVLSLFIESWVMLLQDSPLNPFDKPLRTYKAFLRRIASEGIKSVVVGFTNLAHELVSQLSLMGTSSFIGDWVDGFEDTPIFFEYHRFYQTGDLALLDYIYTFLNFGKKLDYVDDAFNEVAFRDWCKVEDELNDLKLDSTDLASLRVIVGKLLNRLDIHDFRPKFGPGSVSERAVHGRIPKINNLSHDPIIDRFLLRGVVGNYGLGVDQGLHKSKIIPDPDKWDPCSGVSSRSSRLMFVPKNLKTARSICMEPNTLMFFQQGILAEMIRTFDESLISRFVNLKDQSRNRELASFGSYTGEVDTLDLSAASDRVAYRLVKSVFPNSWQIPMRAARSDNCILPDGSKRVLQKFAPMGSALCFPTQCVIFVGVCIYAASLYTYEADGAQQVFLKWLNDNVLRVIDLFSTAHSPNRYFHQLAVYGDDICVDFRLTDIVKTILVRLGFVVNVEKSFTASQAFRESCGGFFVDGHDMNPLFFRIKGVREYGLTPEHVASQVHLINEAWDRRYMNLYRHLLRRLMSWGCSPWLRNKHSEKNPIPFVENRDSFGVMCTKAVNSHLQLRHNTDLQRDEVRGWSISYLKRVKPSSVELPKVDAYEYMRWWSGRTDDIVDDSRESVSRFDTGGARLVWVWTPHW